jgi:predicted regulator of Ras-like GTPase activity (Roadblock/LC7/MglB family)
MPPNLRHAVHREMALLRERTPDVIGSITCTVDGMPVAADLPDHTRSPDDAPLPGVIGPPARPDATRPPAAGGPSRTAAGPVDGASPSSGVERAAALSSAVLAMARRMTGLARLGGLEETLISGTDGFAACYAAGPTLVLTVIAGPGSNLGLLRIEGRRTAARLAALSEPAPAPE